MAAVGGRIGDKRQGVIPRAVERPGQVFARQLPAHSHVLIDQNRVAVGIHQADRETAGIHVFSYCCD
jgi:hypothetical protein